MNFFRSLRCWAVLLTSCLLLTAAHAQDAAAPPTGDTTTSAADTSSADDAKATTGDGKTTAGDGKTTTFDSSSGVDSSSSVDSSDDDDAAPDHHHHHHHRSSDNDVVSIGRHAELHAGEHAEGVVAIFGSATSAGEVGDSVVSVLGTTRVTGGKVNNAAVAVMGSAFINGEVNGDVVAVMGNVELGPEAKVHGNVVVVGGELRRDPKAVIDGHVQNVLGMDWDSFGWLRPWLEKCLLYGRPLAFAPGLGWAWGIALGLLALYAFMAFLFRGAVDKCVHTLETQAGHSILAALVLTLGIPVLFVLLFITVLGIAAVPFLAIAVLCAAMFGKIVVLAAIGKRCTPSLANDPTTHTVVGVIVGGLIVMVVYTVPMVGFLVYKLLELLGLGVVVYTLLLSVRAGRLARSGGGPGSGPGAGGGAGGMPGLGGGVGPGRGESSGEQGGTAAGFGGAASGEQSGTAAGFGGAASGDQGGGAAGVSAAASGGPSASASRTSAFGDFTADGPPPGATARGFAAGADEGAGPTNTTATNTGGNTMGSDSMGATAAGATTAGASAGGASTPGATTAGATAAGASTAGATMGGASAGGANASGGGSAAGGGGGPPPFTTSGPGGAGPTGQPLNLSALPRAGFGIRMGALLLDLILIGILTHQLHGFGDLHLIGLAAYGAVMWKLKGSTIGGIICGLQVVRVDGRPIDWATAIVRALGCFLSLAVVGLGFIWIAIDPDHQAWHDKIAGTVVVRAPKGTSLL